MANISISLIAIAITYGFIIEIDLQNVIMNANPPLSPDAFDYIPIGGFELLEIRRFTEAFLALETLDVKWVFVVRRIQLGHKYIYLYTYAFIELECVVRFAHMGSVGDKWSAMPPPQRHPFGIAHPFLARRRLTVTA